MADQKVELKPELKVRNIIRWISKTNVTNDVVQSVTDVNMYLSGFLNDGWRLFDTHFLGENPQAYGVLYVLVR